MPFVCTLDLPSEADVLQGEGETILTLPIGYVSETGCPLSLVTAFSPPAGSGAGELEQVFYIQEYDPDTGAFYRFWDGAATKSIIGGREDRGRILNALCFVTEHLIELVRPRVVSFSTHTQNLPDKALHKYEMVADSYRRTGYDVRSVDPMHGRHMWIAERLDG